MIWNYNFMSTWWKITAISAITVYNAYKWIKLEQKLLLVIFFHTDEKNDTTVAAITTSILLIVFFLAMLMLICFRCFCRSGKLVFRENGDKITGRDIDTQSVAGMDEITPGPPKANVADPQV